MQRPTAQDPEFRPPKGPNQQSPVLQIPNFVEQCALLHHRFFLIFCVVNRELSGNFHRFLRLQNIDFPSFVGMETSISTNNNDNDRESPIIAQKKEGK
jgi:hypothetical protein